MQPQTTQGSPSAEVLGIEADVAAVDAVIVEGGGVVVCVVCGVSRLFNEVRVVVARGGSDGRFPRARSRDPPPS